MATVAKSVILFGKCVTSELSAAVKIRVDKYVMDTRLTMYFKEKDELYAHDPTNNCKEGDYVLISELPEPTEKDIKYVVEKVVYKEGNLIDPLSGRRSAGTEFLDDIKRITEVFDTQKSFRRDL